jgi:hypothetical protein
MQAITGTFLATVSGAILADAPNLFEILHSPAPALLAYAAAPIAGAFGLQMLLCAVLDRRAR